MSSPLITWTEYLRMAYVFLLISKLDSRVLVLSVGTTLYSSIVKCLMIVSSPNPRHPCPLLPRYCPLFPAPPLRFTDIFCDLSDVYLCRVISDRGDLAICISFASHQNPTVKLTVGRNAPWMELE